MKIFNNLLLAAVTASLMDGSLYAARHKAFDAFDGAGGKVEIHNHGHTVIVMGPSGGITVGGAGGQLLFDDVGGPATRSFMGRVSDFVKSHGSTIGHYIEDTGLLDYIRRNKWRLGAQSALLLYCYLNYQLFSLGNFLSGQGRWIYWRPDYSLATLVSVPADTLIAEMTAVVRVRKKDIYKDHEQELGALEELLKELDQELRAVERYNAMAHTIVACDDLQHRCVVFCEGCMPPVFGIPVACLVRGVMMSLSARRLFYINEDLIKSSSEWHHRLSYLKGVVEVHMDRHRCVVGK